MRAALTRRVRRLLLWGLSDEDLDDLTWTERTPEEIRQRRRAEALRARFWALIVLLVSTAVAVGAFALGLDWLQILLVPLSAVLGIVAQEWVTRRRDERQLEQDVVALTAIYYQSPETLRDMLRPDAIDRAIENLLNAALGERDIGSAFWEQSVAPFIHNSGSGYKSDWRYQIDLRDLTAPIEVELEGTEVTFGEQQYRRLHTTVTYEQQVGRPAEVFYVAAVFGGAELPAWFERENFWLREVTELPPDCMAALATRPATPDVLPSTALEAEAHHAAAQTKGMPQQLLDAANVILHTTVQVGEEVITPEYLHLDGQGISWGFVLRPELQAMLRDGTEVHVELDTLVTRDMRYFPVHLNAPTKHPTIYFNYGQTDLPAGAVSTEVFFAAQRPYDKRLRSEYAAEKRIVVRTEARDWVSRGSGCLFHWTQ